MDFWQVVFALKENNMDAHRRLRRKLESMLNATGVHPKLVERSLCLANALRVGDHMSRPPS